MAEIIDYKDKVKRYFLPERREFISMLPPVVGMAFIISFKEWGGETFDVAAGLANFALALLIVAVSFFTFDAGQRLLGLTINYRLRFKVWTFGLLFGLVICFLTNGSVWVLLPSGFLVEHLTGHRLGWFRYGINIFGQGIMALGGPVASIVLIILIKLFSFALPAAFVDKAVLFNVVFAITQMLPIPPLAGSKAYFGSKMTYAFSMPVIVSALLLLAIDIPLFISIGGAILIGLILWILYYAFFEQNVWSGPG